MATPVYDPETKVDLADPELTAGSAGASSTENGWTIRLQWKDALTAPVVTAAKSEQIIDMDNNSAPVTSFTLEQKGTLYRFRYHNNQWLMNRYNAPLTFTDIKTAAYTAKAGEIVLCDTSTASFQVNFPASPVKNARVAFKKVSVDSNAVTLNGNGNSVELRTEFEFSGQAVLLGEGECTTYQFDGTNWLRVASDKLPLYIEAWQYSSIGAGDVIQWTFVPLWTGQVPVLATHASGLFTFKGNLILNVQVNIEVNFVIASNNSDADFTLTPRYTGAGVNLIARIIDSMAHSRAGTFERSAVTNGNIAVFENDTADFTFVDAGQGGSFVDLTAGFLQVTLA